MPFTSPGRGVMNRKIPIFSYILTLLNHSSVRINFSILSLLSREQSLGEKCLNPLVFLKSAIFVVCFLLSNSPASEFYMPTFRNTLYISSSYAVRCRILHLPAYEDGTDRVFRNVGIYNSDAGEHNIQNTAKV